MEEGEISSDSSHREGGHRRGDKVRVRDGDAHRESQVEALLRKKKKIERELWKVQHQSHSHRSPEKRHSSTKKRKKRSRSRTRSRTRSLDDCSTLSPRKSSRRRERRDRAVTELAREEREMVRQRRRLLESGQEAAGDVLRRSHHSHRATESSPRDNRRREERSASVDTTKVIVQKRGRLFARALAAVAPGKVEEDDDVVEEEVVEVPVPPKVVEVIQLDDDDDVDDEAKGDSKTSPHPLTLAFARLLVEEVLGRVVLVADRRARMERDKASQHQRRLQRLRDKKEAARAMEKSRELKAQVSLALGSAWQAMANNWSSSEDVGKDQEYHGKEKTRSGDFWSLLKERSKSRAKRRDEDSAEAETDLDGIMKALGHHGGGNGSRGDPSVLSCSSASSRSAITIHSSSPSVDGDQGCGGSSNAAPPCFGFSGSVDYCEDFRPRGNKWNPDSDKNNNRKNYYVNSNSGSGAISTGQQPHKRFRDEAEGKRNQQ